MSNTLFDVVSWIESKSRMDAVRFEPRVYQKITTEKLSTAQSAILAKIQLACGCSFPTATVIYCSSWGTIQLMGFNLYGTENYNKSVVDFCNSLCDQKVAFENFCRARHLNDITPDLLAVSGTARNRFATVYNGSVDYIAPMKLALIHFGYHITG